MSEQPCSHISTLGAQILEQHNWSVRVNLSLYQWDTFDTDMDKGSDEAPAAADEERTWAERRQLDEEHAIEVRCSDADAIVKELSTRLRAEAFDARVGKKLLCGGRSYFYSGALVTQQPGFPLLYTIKWSS